MNNEHVEKTSFWRSPAGLVLCGFLAVAVLLILLEYQARVLGLWPLLILLVCGGMHFMHRRHSSHEHGDSARGQSLRRGR
jgi:hypothetical protein